MPDLHEDEPSEPLELRPTESTAPSEAPAVLDPVTVEPRCNPAPEGEVVAKKPEVEPKLRPTESTANSSQAPAVPEPVTVEPGCNPEPEGQVLKKPEEEFDVLNFKVSCL